MLQWTYTTDPINDSLSLYIGPDASGLLFLYQNGSWVGDIATSHQYRLPSIDLIVSVAGSSYDSTDVNIIGSKVALTTPQVMDLEQVYDIAISAGGGEPPIIESYWETNASDQLVPVNTTQTVLLDKVRLGADYNATPIISGTATVWGDIAVSGNGPILGKIYTTTASGDIYASSQYGGNIYTTNGYISAKGANGYISAQGDIYSNNGNIYSSNGNISTSNGSITANGANGDMACTQNMSVGHELKVSGNITGGGILTVTDYISTMSRGSESIVTQGGISSASLMTGSITSTASIDAYQVKAGPGGITLGGVNRTSWASTTVTHLTNILDFDQSKIGCFCEGVGELADVYNKDGVNYTPTIDRATDAIVKVRPSTSLNMRVLGIITGQR
jgi:hypothetical protein